MKKRKKKQKKGKKENTYNYSKIWNCFKLIIISFAWFDFGGLICLGNMNFALPCIRGAVCI